MQKWCYIPVLLILLACEAEISKVPFVDDIQMLSSEEKVDFLRERLDDNPENASILMQISNSFVEVNIDSAIYYANLALANTERKGPVYYTLATIYNQDNQPLRALEAALMAEEFGLVSSELKNLIAAQYLNIQNYAKADLYLSQALQLADANQESTFMQAKLDLVKGDTFNAVRKLNRIDLEQLKYEKYFQLGVISFRRGQDSVAKVQFRKAIQANSENPEPFRKLAKIFERNQQPDSALLTLQQIPMEYEDVMMAADIYYGELVWDSTLVLVNRASKLNSMASDPHLLKAKVHMGRRNFSRSRQIYDSLIVADSSNIAAIEGRRMLEGRIQYLIRQQEERKKQDSLRFRPLRIREF